MVRIPAQSSVARDSAWPRSAREQGAASTRKLGQEGRTAETLAFPDQGSRDGSGEARLREQLRQLSADFENFRRRSEAAHARAFGSGQDRFLEEVVPVIVDLRAALELSGDDQGEGVRKGIELVLTKLEACIEALGYSRVPTVGERMDPRRHEAIFTVPSTEHPPKVVLRELAPGFERNGRVVLPARVAVSRSPAPEGR